MFRIPLVLAALLTPLSTPLLPAAMAAGTPEEQAACRPDVRRFCPRAGQDEMVVLGCLQQNREKLTKACRKVLESHGV